MWSEVLRLRHVSNYIEALSLLLPPLEASLIGFNINFIFLLSLQHFAFNDANGRGCWNGTDTTGIIIKDTNTMKNKTHRKRFFIAPMSKMKNQHVADGGKKGALKRPQWIVLIIKKKGGNIRQRSFSITAIACFFVLSPLMLTWKLPQSPENPATFNDFFFPPFFRLQDRSIKREDFL